MFKKLIVSLVAGISFSAIPSTSVPSHSIDEDEINWLAMNVYFEARGETRAGMLAVMMVTLNRVADPRFPNTVKEVVTQGGTKPYKCQFSWYCDGKSDKIYDWNTFHDIKVMILNILPKVHKIKDITNNALYYHAVYVSPYWSHFHRKTARIDNHIFYR